MRNRPSWRSGQKAESFLQFQVIDLINNTVNIVRQVSPILHQRFEAFQQLRVIATDFIIWVDRETERLNIIKKFNLALPPDFRYFAPGIHQKTEIPLAGNARVKLAQRTSSRISRIRKSFFMFRLIFLI